MYRTLFGILAVFAAALFVVGLTFSKTVDRPADFRFSNGVEPKTLDPATATGESEGRLGYALFEGLLRKDAKSLQPAPGVAERWDVSEDELTYTFHLRDNALWSDGRKVTAHDFVYSFKRIVEPKIASEYAYIAFPIRYAEAYATYDGHAAAIAETIGPALAKLGAEFSSGVPAKRWQQFLAAAHVHDALRRESDPLLLELLGRREGVVTRGELDAFQRGLEKARARLIADAREARARFGVDAGLIAKDERTLVIELRAPIPYFLELITFHTFMPVPRQVVEKHPSNWFLPETIVTNGPFRLARWRVNDRMRLEKSDNYWGKDEVRLDSIEAFPSDNETTTLNRYLTGDLDWIPKEYPRELVPVLQKRDDFYQVPALVVYYYRINNTRPPFNDKRVRQALNLAVDRRLIVEKVTGVGEIPATTFVPPGIPGYEPPESDIRLDVERARALLAEAGFPGGRGFPKSGILYNTMDMHRKIADVIADQLRRNLNIDVQSYNQEWQAYQETTRQLDYDLGRAGWIGDYLDPNTFLDMWVTNGGNNQTGFGAPFYDRLVRMASDVSILLADPETVLSKVREPERLRPLIGPASSGSPKQKLEARQKIRMQLFREAEAILVKDEFPIMPLYFYVNTGLKRPKVRGFYTTLELPDGTKGVNLQDIHPLRDIFIAEGRGE